MSEAAEPESRGLEAPFGVAVPRIYRKRPQEALTAQAYFYLFWWYRAALSLFIVGTLLLVAAVSLLLLGATILAAGSAVVAVTIQVVAGFGWALAAVEAPKDKMALYVDADGPAL